MKIEGWQESKGLWGKPMDYWILHRKGEEIPEDIKLQRI